MSAFPLGRLVLLAQVAIYRAGLGNLSAGLLCLAASICWLGVIPYLHAELATQQDALQRTRNQIKSAQRPPSVVPRSEAEEHLANFYSTLGKKNLAEQQVKTLFAVARKTALRLNQAEYKLAFDQNGNYYTYQIILPVKGSYSDIRPFCEQMLMTIPFASLDEMSFNRDAIADQTLEVKLHFTIFLSDESPAIRTSHGTPS